MTVTSLVVRIEQCQNDAYNILLFSDYENQNLGTNEGGQIVDCESVPGRRPSKDWDKACKFDLTENLGLDCIKQQVFGFDDGMPCILLKLNRVSSCFALVTFIILHMVQCSYDANISYMYSYREFYLTLMN